MRHLFPELCQTEINQARDRIGLLVQDLLSILFSLDFFPLPSIAHLWNYRIYSSIIFTLPEISRALASIPFIDSPSIQRVADRSRKVASTANERVGLDSSRYSRITARENIVFAIPLLYQPCLKFRVWKAEITRKLERVNSRGKALGGSLGRLLIVKVCRGYLER